MLIAIQQDMGNKRGRNILVVDDDKRTRFCVRLTLELAGFMVNCCPNGIEALHSISAASKNGFPYDCMICDIQMPQMNGEELLHNLTTLGYTLPVIVITGIATNELVLQKIVGKHSLLRKPIDADRLVEQVRQTLAESESSDTQYVHHRKGCNDTM